MTDETEENTQAREDGVALDAAPVILASASSSRRRLLRNAGIKFEADAAHVDEDEIKRALKAEGASAAQTAETLAELKAQRISRRYPGILVIGADQMLDCNGVWFDKPSDLDHAAAHLAALGGKEHSLLSAVCVVRDGVRLWHYNDMARLTMRSLTDSFIADYLADVGEDALSSVGAYQLEGRGIQLFARVDGDFFSILGLPLLPLLDFLRNNGVIPE